MSVTRPLAGTVDVSAEVRALHEELARTGSRAARTLIKEGALRVTLVGINPGGELRPHRAEGPITVHVLEGEIEFHTGEARSSLTAGMLLSLPGGVEHGVRSTGGGVFLLTLAAP